MEKTTIYLDEEIKEHLIDLAAKMSREKRKRVAITDIIREALKEYLRKKGISLEGKEEAIRRMLSTRGALDSDEFEKRVIEVKKEVIVTRRGKPIGIFRPIDKDEVFMKERMEIGKKIIGLGKGTGGRVSEEHDKIIYER